MTLYCGLCMHTYHGQMTSRHEAITVINGQAVCGDHTGYVQGGQFSQVLAFVQKEAN